MHKGEVFGCNDVSGDIIVFVVDSNFGNKLVKILGQIA
jgi:hypothetical protein